jgi:hypothetical protein
MKFDYGILRELSSEKEGWEPNSVVLKDAFIYDSFIISSYEKPSWLIEFGWPNLVVTLDEYQMKLKQKERNNKLNNLGI